MNRRGYVTAAAAIAVAAVIVVPFAVARATTGAHGGHDSQGYSSRPVVRGGPLTSTISFDPGEFAPPPAHPRVHLTAQQAYDRWTHSTRTIPPVVSYQLGVVTDPPSTTATGVLAWGFSTGPTSCDIVGGPGMVPPSPPPKCIEWDFVNARTGRGIIGEFKQIDSPH
jgi:hypothetical protein